MRLFRTGGFPSFEPVHRAPSAPPGSRYLPGLLYQLIG